MNFTKLKYFNAVCRCQSVSEAAEYLHVSQPSLSSAIKELENEFGVSLFSRHYRGVSLTSEGQVLYNLSQDILNRSEQIEDIMKELGVGRKKLRVGVPPMIGSLILPRIYEDFLHLHKDIEVEITEGSRNELVPKLTENYLDMVFLSHGGPLDPTFSTLLVTQLEIVCCASKKHAIAKHKTICPSMLKDIPLVLFKDTFFQTEKIREWFYAEQIVPNIIFQTEQLSAMSSMISNNLAVGFMFRQMVDANPDLVAIPTVEPLYINISLIWKKDAYFFQSMNIFKKYINEKNPFS